MEKLNERPCVLDLHSIRVKVKASANTGNEWNEWWDIEFPLYRACVDCGHIFIKIIFGGEMKFALYFRTTLTELWDADAFVETLVNQHLIKECTFYHLLEIVDYRFK